MIASRMTPKKILLVDDDRDLVDLWKRFLVEAGYEVDIAYDGREGLGLALKGGYALVVLDAMMPRMDGLGVLEQMNSADPRPNNGPVVMISNLDRYSLSAKAVKLGALGCITKSNTNPAAFVSEVKKFLTQVG